MSLRSTYLTRLLLCAFGNLGIVTAMGAVACVTGRRCHSHKLRLRKLRPGGAPREHWVACASAGDAARVKRSGRRPKSQSCGG